MTEKTLTHASTLPPIVKQWFQHRKWRPFPYQERTWSAYARGRSGLIHAPTGMGKSYAAWLGPVIDWIQANPDREAWPEMEAPPLTVLWITPLRALATDTTDTLLASITDLGLPWTVERRTGDTSAAMKARQRKRPPTALITTPESLSLLLSYPDTRAQFRHLRCVIVDEWHELLGSKRGVQTELGLARLRHWQPEIRVWGLSATLGNLTEAAAVLLPQTETPEIIAGDTRKVIRIETLIPENIERFPRAGHLGLQSLPQVVARIQAAASTLVFTNTRAQTERWFQALIDAHPEFAGEIALHHGSLDPKLRAEVEDRLRDGRLRCVVCTSSLDLGVDFSPVEQVIQIGSPKGVARLMQRAGRSGHRPGAVSRVICVPTHAFELVEFAAARAAMERGEIEARRPLEKPLDLLVQHLVTIGLGGGFAAEALPAEIRSTYAYRNLSDEEWAWALAFVSHGGAALRAYPEYTRVVERDGIYRGSTRQIAQLHRMSIGTITSDSMLTVKYQRGRTLGSIEESFVARLRPGDKFVFSGQVLELVRTKDMTVFVRRSRSKRGIVPRWMGGRMQFSSRLAGSVRVQLDEAAQGRYHGPEMEAVRPLLAFQARRSRIPTPEMLLIETCRSREGYHTFVFPLQGRLVHEGLSTVLAYRIARAAPRTITTFATDYGFELRTADPLPLDESAWRQVLAPDGLVDDVLACINDTELARRQFRDVARVAGLIFSGYPGKRKTTRQLQASSGILFDVFRDYEPDNLLLDQARREVLADQLDVRRLQTTLDEIAGQDLVQVETGRLTPLAFPIWAEFLRSQVSSETWSDRVARMVIELEEDLP